MPGEISFARKATYTELPPTECRYAFATGESGQRSHANLAGDQRTLLIVGDAPGVGPVPMKNSSSLGKQREGFWFLIGERPSMRDLANDLVANKAHGIQRPRLVDRAFQPAFVPKRAAVTENVFHHVADKALVLLELTGKTDEPRILIVGRIEELHWSAIITYRDDRVRIISVRRSRREEVTLYEG